MPRPSEMESVSTAGQSAHPSTSTLAVTPQADLLVHHTERVAAANQGDHTFPRWSLIGWEHQVWSTGHLARHLGMRGGARQGKETSLANGSC